MKELTSEQRKKIINYIKRKKTFLGNGSSRAVYQLGRDLVVKIAFDVAGKTQNNREVELYQATKSKFLARIVAKSEDMVIMQKVPHILFDIEDYSETKRQKIISKYHEVIQFLNHHLGYTPDNEQIGLLKDEPIAYDYGYDTNEINNISFSLIDNIENGNEYNILKYIL